LRDCSRYTDDVLIWIIKQFKNITLNNMPDFKDHGFFPKIKINIYLTSKEPTKVMTEIPTI
jgi:hypothetical protein